MIKLKKELLPREPVIVDLTCPVCGEVSEHTSIENCLSVGNTVAVCHNPDCDSAYCFICHRAVSYNLADLDQLHWEGSHLMYVCPVCTIPEYDEVKEVTPK